MANLLQSLYDTGLAETLRTSLLAFPLVETVHVVAITLVVGTILIVDLRLLGLASAGRSYTRLSSELLKWTWIGFAIALVSGVTMFTSNAMVYFENTAFRIKMLMMLVAGINMAIFQLLTEKSVRSSDDRSAGPPAARIAAIVSLCMWVSVVVAGRWIGFTLAGKTEAPAAEGVNFDDFLGDTAAAPPPAPVAPATPTP